ncbi:MAG: isochorismate synthase, partial [Candidatus Omnitrophica bacterium]|nr:isochorismate synthase [Candidatus Omnitrophota bacterium]
FCFQPSQHHGFIGATPERLMKMDGARLQTEALAGTMPCGDDEALRDVNRERLIDSEKCRREHDFVVEFLRHHLTRLCKSFESGTQPEVLQLKSVQHLRTSMHGELRAGYTRADVLAALHPTPAVCGYPVEETMGELSRLETFPRGWYAGPVGFVSHDSCEFAVAIRSGLVKDHLLSLYAGAGIVEGSTALEEWQEVENKISRFMKVFQ